MIRYYAVYAAAAADGADRVGLISASKNWSLSDLL